jgi:predicted peroxiredoxin
MPDTETRTTDKVTIVATDGTDGPQFISLPFIIGNTALAMDTAVTVLLQGSTVFAATKSCIRHGRSRGKRS